MDPAQLEDEHVRQVYEGIAHHFSSTRYKAWPVVEEFVRRLSAGSVGVDVGSGNGKNILLRRDEVHFFAFDLSAELLQICQKQGFPTVQGTMLSLPFRSRSQDFAMCIAALHHLASAERRLHAVAEIGRILRPGGEALLYVWAWEQPETSSLYKQRGRLQFLSDDQQDVLVPWTLSNLFGEVKTQLRFYHLFRKGELEELCTASGLFDIVYSGYDRDNWFVCVRRKMAAEVPSDG